MRYVVLHHTGWQDDHFDLMLEGEKAGKLRTWRLDAFPDPGQITALEEHRRDYLTYEGPISNDRGQVKRVSAGEYEILRETDRNVRVRLSAEEIELDLPLQTAHP
jgi:hypothetical protein